MQPRIFPGDAPVYKWKHRVCARSNPLAPHTIGFNGWLTIEGCRKINVQWTGVWWQEVITPSRRSQWELFLATNLLHEQREWATLFPGLNGGGD